MRLKNNTIAYIIIFCLSTVYYCQNSTTKKEKKFIPTNLSVYDNSLIHMGFILGFNSSSFKMLPASQYQNTDSSFRGIQLLNTPGFCMGLLGDITLFETGDFLTVLRINPTISFEDRIIAYNRIDSTNQNIKSTTNITESVIFYTYTDIIVRSKRYKNNAIYLFMGSGFSFNITAIKQQENSNVFNIEDISIQNKITSTYYRIGTGMDFFFPYFKLGIEVSFLQSFQNIFIQDNSIIADKIQELYNRSIYLTFIFQDPLKSIKRRKTKKNKQSFL